MSGKLQNILDDGPCLSPDELKAFAEGRLEGARLHRAEKHLLGCPFCADALEGIRSADVARRMPVILAGLDDAIDARTTKKRAAPLFTPSRIAAAVALLLLTGATWYYLASVSRNEKIYSDYYTPYQVPAEPAPQVKDEGALDNATMATPPVAEEPVKFKDATKKQTDPETKKAEENLAAGATQPASAEHSVVVTDDGYFSTHRADTFSFTNKENQDLSTLKEDQVDKDVALTEVTTTQKARTKSMDAKPAAPAAATTVAEGNAMTDARKVTLETKQLSRAPLQDAIRQYEAKNYSAAYKQAEAFLDDHPRDPEALFYSGMSAMNLHKEKTAAKRLESCLAHDTGQWKEDASWYLALCYVKLNEPSKAKPLLEFLANGKSVHAVEAAKMLQTLK